MEISNFADEVDYCEQTGLFKSKKSRGNKAQGSLIGTIRPDGYVEMQILGKRVFAHRLAFALSHGYWPFSVDHINRVKSDNRIENLREVTTAQNNLNVCKPTSNRFKGISFKNGKWQAAIRVDGKLTYIGRFASDVEAAHAYDIKSIEHHKEYGKRNFLPLI